MAMQFSNELFPQLDVLNSAQNQSNHPGTYNTDAYLQTNQEQLSYYFYEQSQQRNYTLESDTMLYPNTVQSMIYSSYDSQPCNITYSQPMLQQQSLSPLSVESDHFNQQQYPLIATSPPYYYDGTNMSLMTPPATVYDPLYISPPAAMRDTLSTIASPLKRRSSISSLFSLSSNTSRTIKKSNNPVLFHCEYEGCNKTFTRTYNLKSHRRTHTDEKPFSCHLCPKAFARQHDRNRHEKLHLGLKPYPCDFCSKSFARLDALNRHLKRDRGNKEAPPPCLLVTLKKKHLLTAKKKKKDLV